MISIRVLTRLRACLQTWTTSVIALAAVLAIGRPALADNVLHPGTPVLDRPTFIALGIRLPVSGDDNLNAVVNVQYRKSGSATWLPGLPLFRVHPGVVAGYTVARQFAGSIFNLRPNTTYEIQLHAYDPDGPVNQTMIINGTTRAVPVGPASPVVHNVASAAALSSALRAAQPGDVIVLANGLYTGAWTLSHSGTAGNPIVLRGASEDGTILDGGNCASCNVLEIYGSYVHIENLTVRNAQRAIRFFNPSSGPATANVVRRVHISNTIMGIGCQKGQLDFYIADNILQGRLSWPKVYSDDNGAHSNDDGIRVAGIGHVVAHNRIAGYGDAMKTEQVGARAVDFYGNDILWTYDNGVELDESEGNVRCFSNRFTNTYASISTQPIYGGPAYIFRNVVLNAAEEQLKFHPLNGTEPSGMLVYHNTFVSPKQALNLQTGSTSHYFAVENNLIVGPDPLEPPANGYTVDWTGGNDHGTFDYNGYSPNGKFGYLVNRVFTTFTNFAGLQTRSSMEHHGLILASICVSGSPFASCLAPPASYVTKMIPPTAAQVKPAQTSGAIDHYPSLRLPNINDTPSATPGVNLMYSGIFPDLGAIEAGCKYLPIYGPRPAGVDERNQALTCN